MLPGDTKNEMMAWGFRAIIAFLVVVGLPAMGYLLERVLNKADEISDTVHSHDTKLQLLGFGNDEIKERLTGIKETLQDHENRIRNMERGPR